MAKFMSGELKGPSRDERNWAIIAHLSALSAVFTGIGMIVGPLVVWLIKRDDGAYIADQAREALNFNITMFIAYVVAALLVVVAVGLLLLPVLAIAHLVLIIIAMVQAGEGREFRYPFALRLIN